MIVGASLSEPHTGGSRFNRGMMVTFPKVYAMNTESPTLLVVDSTTYLKVYVISTEGLAQHVACSVQYGD